MCILVLVLMLIFGLMGCTPSPVCVKSHVEKQLVTEMMYMYQYDFLSNGYSTSPYYYVVEKDVTVCDKYEAAK